MLFKLNSEGQQVELCFYVVVYQCYKPLYLVYEYECGYMRKHLWTLLYPPASVE